MNGSHSHILREIYLDMMEGIASLSNNTLVDINPRDYNYDIPSYEDSELVFLRGKDNNIRLARLVRDWQDDTWKARVL